MRSSNRNSVLALVFGILSMLVSGCYAPLRTTAVPASSLPDTFRTPWRTGGAPLNLSSLTVEPPRDYFLGANDLLEVTIPGLYERSEIAPLRVQVMGNGHVHLPLVGSVMVGNMNLSEAQAAICAAYANGFIVDPRVNVALAEKSTTSVLVLGQVNAPGTYLLPKYENDIGHALGAAGGLTPDAADYIEVHRRVPKPLPHAAVGARHFRQVSWYDEVPSTLQGPKLSDSLVKPNRLPPTDVVPHEAATFAAPPPVETVQPIQAFPLQSPQILRIPLRGADPGLATPSNITLGPGDVVVVPDRKHEVFYVVGRLSTTNTVRFTVGDRERELGVGFVLPRDREIDVVTAVALAGYIDPIDSPTTVTVHRTGPDGQPMLIKVDLIKARYNRLETILVEPGDIIYLNPDSHWWWRRFIDRVLVDAFRAPYNKVFR